MKAYALLVYCFSLCFSLYIICVINNVQGLGGSRVGVAWGWGWGLSGLRRNVREIEHVFHFTSHIP